MKYIMTELKMFPEEIWDLDTETVTKCVEETKREYPRVKTMIFWNSTYPVNLRDDGTGWVKIPKGMVSHD